MNVLARALEVYLASGYPEARLSRHQETGHPLEDLRIWSSDSNHSHVTSWISAPNQPPLPYYSVFLLSTVSLFLKKIYCNRKLHNFQLKVPVSSTFRNRMWPQSRYKWNRKMWNFMEKCVENWRISLSLSLSCSQFTQSSKDRLASKWDFLHAAVTRREKEETENRNVSPPGFHALSEVISQTERKYHQR